MAAPTSSRRPRRRCAASLLSRLAASTATNGAAGENASIDIACSVGEAVDDDLLALDEALTRLSEQDPARGEIVKLRFFGGLTMPEAAAVLGVSLATAERYWTFARTWLYAELT